MVLKYINYEIELINEASYVIGSTDNASRYDFEYNGDVTCTAKHGVLLKKDGKVVRSAILFGSAGQTGIHQRSAIVFDDMLIVCVSNKVFCLYLPSLELRWAREIDEVACLQIFKTSESYLIHGKMAITRIEFTGDLIWSFSDEAIFVSKDDKNTIELTAQGIEITDWRKKEHLLGYDGVLIS